MASLIQYTKGMFVERIKRHMSDDFSSADFSTSDREILLYIDQAAAATLIGQVYGAAKVEGNLATPEAWLTTYLLISVLKDSVTGNWYATLPQPPVSLPLGYSISSVYAGLAGNGRSQDFVPIKAKRVGYRNLMPIASGGRYWVEGDKIWMALGDGGALTGLGIYVSMAKTRTESMSETMNLPDDAIESIFQNVVAKMTQRMQLPKDVIQDDISAGNKTS